MYQASKQISKIHILRLMLLMMQNSQTFLINVFYEIYLKIFDYFVPDTALRIRYVS